MSVSENQPEIRFQCHDALEVCLAIEKEGVAYYEKAAQQAKSPDVREVFKTLAQDEKDHAKSLVVKSRFLQPALQKRAGDNLEVRLFIENEVKGRVFPINADKPGAPPEVDTDIQAVEVGMDSEKRSIEILDQLLHNEKKIDVRVIFSHLLVEEKKHLIALQRLQAALRSA